MRGWAMALALLGACSFTGAAELPGDGRAGSDAPPPDALGTPVWGAPTLVGLAEDPSDDDPSLTEDELELFFNSSRNSGNPDIWVVKRATTTDPWGTPERVNALSSVANETTPEVSADGLIIYFGSDRLGGVVAGGMDIWTSTRPSRQANWGNPVFVAELSSVGSDAAGSTADDLHIGFTSSLLGPDANVYLSARAAAADPWSAGVEQVALNTAMHEGSVMLSVDRHWIYFDTNRDGDLELYTAHRSDPTAPFAAPFAVPRISAAASGEQDPWISPDGRHLVFMSDRGGAYQMWEARR